MPTPAGEQQQSPPEGLPVAPLPRGAMWMGELQRRYWFVVDASLAALLVVAIIGFWAYAEMRGSMRELRSEGIGALLETEARAMQIWIEEKLRDAERWADTVEVRRATSELARLARAGPAAPCAAHAQRVLRGALGPATTLERTVAFNLFDRDGTILAAQADGPCGQRVVDPGFRRQLATAFAGQRDFAPPSRESERLGAGGGNALILIWALAPVRGDDGSVVAVLGFARPAGDRFARLLALAGTRSTREAYAFDARAVLLTESGYRDALSRAGALAPGGSGILGLATRDPGGDLLAGFQPADAADRPLTALVQEAFGALPGNGEVLQGILLEPYRNYRGAEVIGGWRWLDSRRIAVAVEIEAAEAFAPVRYLQIAFAVLTGLLLAALLAASAASFWALGLRAREAKRIGQYRIIRKLGEGGLSHVYLARHTHLKRPVAVKVLKGHLATDEAVARFEREVQLCSQLTHPNTIDIYDFGRTRDGTFYYTMEYLHGISLEMLVRREGAQPVSRATHLLRQACASLREAHARGLVHRDVKPHNLMLCTLGGQYDVLKVLDFGLVKQIHDTDTRDLTQYARVLGTPLYMAPERLRNPADADARSDIYALGAVAHFLLTGKNLFEAATDHDLIHQVLEAPPPGVSARGAADVPPILEALILRCLAKDRESRPSTIDEVDQVLAEVARARPWREAEARAWWKANAGSLGIEPADAEPVVAGE